METQESSPLKLEIKEEEEIVKIGVPEIKFVQIETKIETKIDNKIKS